jgi:hypothetical protein
MERSAVVTLLHGEDAQIHSAGRFSMLGHSCARFFSAYGADTRFGLRSRRLAPRSWSTANNPLQTIHCKQSTANNPLQTIQANNSTPNKSTANNPMQTIQLSSRAQRGIPVVIPSAAEESRLSSRTQRGISVVIPSAARNLGFFGAASTTSGNSHHTP